MSFTWAHGQSRIQINTMSPLTEDQITGLSHANTHCTYTHSLHRGWRPSSRHQRHKLQPGSIWCFFTITSLVVEALSLLRPTSAGYSATWHTCMWPICSTGLRVEPIVQTNRPYDQLLSSAWLKLNIQREHPFRLNSGTTYCIDVSTRPPSLPPPTETLHPSIDKQRLPDLSLSVSLIIKKKKTFSELI